MTDEISTARRLVTIVNQKGLHARASAKLARLAQTLPTKVYVEHDGETADASSIMDLLMLAAHQGCEVEIWSEGSEANACLDAVSALIMNGFGELDDPTD